MLSMPSVSHSEVDSYLLCRRKHYYGYGLSLERVTTSQALATGTAGHAILEAFYGYILESGGTVEDQAIAFDQGVILAEHMYKEIVEDGYENAANRAELKEMLFNPEWGYFANEHMIKNGWRVLAVEQEFNLLYNEASESRYPFVVDMIVEDPSGKIVVIDHKFVYDFYTPSQTDLQPQIPKYIGALRAMNYPVAYGAYNMLRTRKLKTPEADNMNYFMILKPNSERVLNTFMEQLGVAAEIQALKELPIEEQSKRAYRTANKMVCQSCSFRDICSTELMGGNTELMIKTEYKIRERRVIGATNDKEDNESTS
jgi:CRISPR/Cas system-associated exonuclease Cas4 (RecB family)